MKRTIKNLQKQGWHLVQLDYGNPDQIDSRYWYSTSKAQYQEMFKWCSDTMDKTKWYGNANLSNGRNVLRFCFENERDKVMFILRWS